MRSDRVLKREQKGREKREKQSKATSFDKIQEYRKLYRVKATLEIPDDLYRRVKARSAMEGRPVRSVAIELLQNWIDAPPRTPCQTIVVKEDKSTPWLTITRRALRPGMRHDLESIRSAVATGWAEEATEKAPSSRTTRRS